MTSIKDLDECSALFLEQLHEPGTNDFCINVIEGIPAAKPEKLEISGVDLGLATSIDANQDSRRFRILFEEYVSYSVLNESFSSTPSKHEHFSGNRFREYSVSQYLEYIKTNTYASDEYPGKLRHFQILCEDHTIDVVSEHAPAVSLVAA